MNTTEKPDSPEYEINIESTKNTIAEMKQRSWNMVQNWCNSYDTIIFIDIVDNFLTKR